MLDRMEETRWMHPSKKERIASEMEKKGPGVLKKYVKSLGGFEPRCADTCTARAMMITQTSRLLHKRFRWPLVRVEAAKRPKTTDT